MIFSVIPDTEEKNIYKAIKKTSKMKQKKKKKKLHLEVLPPPYLGATILGVRLLLRTQK